MTTCLVCSASFDPRSALAWRKDGYDIVRCPSCGLVSRAELPDEEALAGIYDEGYFRDEPSSGDRRGYADYLRDGRLHRANARRRVRLLANFASRPGSLVDVGCAAGFFVDEAAVQAGTPRAWTSPQPWSSGRGRSSASQSSMGASRAVTSRHRPSTRSRCGTTSSTRSIPRRDRSERPSGSGPAASSRSRPGTSAPRWHGSRAAAGTCSRPSTTTTTSTSTRCGGCFRGRVSRCWRRAAGELSTPPAICSTSCRASACRESVRRGGGRDRPLLARIDRSAAQPLRHRHRGRPPSVTQLRLQLARFVVVGLGNTLVSVVVYWLLLDARSCYVVAAPTAYAASLVTGYVFNRRWTFGARDSTQARAKYVLVQVGGAALTSLAVALLVSLGLGEPRSVPRGGGPGDALHVRGEPRLDVRGALGGRLVPPCTRR